jgi:hypothetical protein
MSDGSKDETSSVTAKKRNHRNRNTKVLEIASKLAGKDEIIKRLEVENGILQKEIGRSTANHLHPRFRPAPPTGIRRGIPTFALPA